MLSYFKNTALSTKLMVLAMSTSIIAICIVSAVVYQINSISGFNQLYDDLKVVSKVVANRSVAAIDFEDAVLAKQNLRVLEIKGSIYLGCMYAESGAVFASHSMGKADAQCPPFSNVSEVIDDKGIVIVEPILFDERLGTLVVFASMDVLHEKNQTLLKTLVVTSLLAGVAAFLLAHYLGYIVIHPIHTLRETIKEVHQSDDYSIRAVRASKDELGDLTDDFNRMLEKIEFDNDALMVSEKRFKSLSESSPVGIFLTDSKGQIVYANEQWRRISGLEKGQDIGRWLGGARQEESIKVQEVWRQAVERAENFNMDFSFNRSDGQAVAVVCRARAMYTEQRQLQGYIGSLLDISDLKKAQKQLEKLALYDPLTNVANRVLFKNSLSKAIFFSKRHKTNIGLIFLDIDNFKRINDTMGHEAGDQLLRVIAERIKSCVRGVDTVARLGGDEFVVLVDDVKDQEITDHIATQLICRIREPINIYHHELVVTTSVGVTLAPSDGDTVSRLMRNADLAMYRAKATGKDMFQYYSKDMNLAMLHKLNLEKELRKALERDEFLLVYQQQYDLDKDRVSGFESLLRWRSPVRGMVSPAEIIPIAEETGLIHAVGEWIIKTACSDAVNLVAEGILPSDGRVAINLSVKQFRNGDFFEKFVEIAETTDVNLHNIELEVTETILMEEYDHVIQKLNKLKQLGVSIAVDDFGTGYSSLSYLKQLPIDYIKVDKSFIDGIPYDTYDVEITSAIIAMSHKLGLSVIAEGVETPEQLQFLKENQCDHVQGFYFGKGETIEAIC